MVDSDFFLFRWSMRPSSGWWREWNWCGFFCVYREGGNYASMSSIGMVLAVEVGLKDGMDSMSDRRRGSS